MGKFTKIPESTFKELQLDAGVLLKNFDPTTATFEDSDIVCATTGGITATCTPTFSDFGSDVDNCPNDLMEMKHLDSLSCTLAFTSIGVSESLIKLSLGCADIESSKNLVKPRRDLKQEDFSDIWWVGDRADGGLVAVKLINALSTGGLSLKTTKNGKGQISVTLTGHVSINAQDVMPMEFYSKGGSDE